MTFGQFLSILRARWRVLLLVLGATVATTVAVSLLLPRQYTATAAVVVDNKPDPVSAVFYGGLASPVFIATQVDVIRSERVALRVVRNLRLADNPQVREQWLEDTKGEGTVEQWLVGLFQKQMDVAPSRESSVIAISYQGPAVQHLLRQPRQGSARGPGAGAEPRLGLPEGQRHHRHR